MIVSYDNRFNKKYMVIQNESPCEGYIYKMLFENKIGNILNMERVDIKGVSNIYYDITALISIKEYCDSKALKYDSVINIIKTLNEAICNLSEYLIPYEYLYIKSDTIYVDYDISNVHFTVYPDKNSDEKSFLISFAEFLVEKADYTDEKTVNLVYEIYNRVSAGSYSLENVIKKYENDKSDEIHNYIEESSDIVSESINKTEDKYPIDTHTNTRKRFIFFILALILTYGLFAIIMVLFTM